MLQGDADYGEVLRKIGMKVDFSENGVKTENKGGLKGSALTPFRTPFSLWPQ